MDTHPGLTFSETDFIEVEGATIYMLHDLSHLDRKPKAAQIGAVVYGHSHQPKIESKTSPIHHPGSAGPKIFNLPIT